MNEGALKVQATVTDVRRAVLLITTALETAPEEYPLDYDALQTHTCAAVNILRDILAELEGVERDLDALYMEGAA